MSSYSLKKIGLKAVSFSSPGSDFKPDDKIGVSINRDHSEPDEQGEFEVIVSVEITPANLEDALVAVTYFGIFQYSEEPKNLKFKEFATINAPAIIFPYIRQFVRSVTLEAGLNPIILPIVNFVDLQPENEE